MAYIPNGYEQFATPMILQVPSTEKVLGVVKKTYTDKRTIFTTIKSYGGTETIVDGVIQTLDTINILTWYDMDIKADCRLRNPTDGSLWAILGRPENVEMRNVYMQFKCQKVSGENGS